MGGILHRKQQWFHGSISREESEYRMRACGLRDGLFLVRERTQVNSFALCLVFQNVLYHYLLDMNPLGQLSIENGRKFENLLQVVDHYSRTPDGLLCSLVDFCPVSMFEDNQKPKVMSRVRHGPLRIDDSELISQGELGNCLTHQQVNMWDCLELVALQRLSRKRVQGVAILRLAARKQFVLSFVMLSMKQSHFVAQLPHRQ